MIFGMWRLSLLSPEAALAGVQIEPDVPRLATGIGNDPTDLADVSNIFECCLVDWLSGTHEHSD